MRDVWGTASNLWAVGAGGVWQYNGSTWTQHIAGESLADYTQVWGSGPSDVWVAKSWTWGSPTTLLHWDGAAWTSHVHATGTRVQGGLSIGSSSWAAEHTGGIIRSRR